MLDVRTSNCRNVDRVFGTSFAEISSESCTEEISVKVSTIMKSLSNHCSFCNNSNAKFFASSTTSSLLVSFLVLLVLNISLDLVTIFSN
jgi:hypothetical protein